MSLERNLREGERWAFDAEVAGAFDDMLRRSIPQIDVMREAVTTLACAFAKKGTDVVDLGAARGEALAPVIARLGALCSYCATEVSPPMLAALREKLAPQVAAGIARVLDHDLRKGVPACDASAILMVLTLQFTPIEHRLRIVRSAWRALRPGGALILVEKVLGASADIDALFVEKYHDVKRANGYSEDEIVRKKLSLEGVLVPVTAAWNEDILRASGFSEVDCFWRWMNFAGWVAVKAAP